MNTAILSKEQQAFLPIFAKQADLVQQFVLSGGTALAGFYIPYRLSEDLDFFSLSEVDTQALTVFLYASKDQLGFQDFELTTSYNRNLFFLRFPHSELKVEFTYFPFSPLEKPITEAGIRIDSLLDIAVNKLFTIYQKPRNRDFMDLYLILKQQPWNITDLINKARVKFDWHVDLLQLGSQFLGATELKDYPHLVTPLPETEWQTFFVKAAKELGKDILAP